MKYTLIALAVTSVLVTGYLMTGDQPEQTKQVTITPATVSKPINAFSNWSHSGGVTPTRQMARQSERVYAPQLPDTPLKLTEVKSEYIGTPIQAPIEDAPVYIPGVEYVPTGMGYGVPASSVSDASNTKFNVVQGKNGINYYGGPLVTNGMNVYLIWYGDWSKNTATTILPDFVKGLNGSSYMNIASSYTDLNGKKSSSIVNYISSTNVGYTKGKDKKGNPNGLNVVDVAGVITNTVKSGTLPKDPNGVYVVMSSADVPGNDGFCQRFCGYHNSYAISPVFAYKFIFVGNTDQCSSACGVITNAGANTPNGNSGADGMASILAHEFLELATDPNFDGWHTSNGSEVGDLCSWNFGSSYKTKSGAAANVKLGNRDFMIQQEWVNAYGGKCAMSYN